MRSETRIRKRKDVSSDYLMERERGKKRLCIRSTVSWRRCNSQFNYKLQCSKTCSCCRREQEGGFPSGEVTRRSGDFREARRANQSSTLNFISGGVAHFFKALLHLRGAQTSGWWLDWNPHWQVPDREERRVSWTHPGWTGLERATADFRVFTFLSWDERYGLLQR